ncbi:hypothetical protein OG563_20060 [Nocardia vinacea]|uniref:Uncharacterized protein n=1 Tax=Nocardia vinacea TaxID=96468 RepID=A0ABZ1Z8A8_9NOCA|nr:hypothetical protein [Nocardia vinacea]
MSGTVRIEPAGDGIWIIAPEGAPTVLDGAAAIDAMVLEVIGGHLSWSLLAGQTIPAAVIDDVELAQDWLWAVYGERIAVTVADFDSGDAELTGGSEFPAEPAIPDLVATAWRLGFAYWATRWWPASSIDGITALDERLLDQEITALRVECDLLIGDDEPTPDEEPAPTEVIATTARAADYALAAGSGADRPTGALSLGRGTGGWDWRRCPPGLIDASERAVSWESTRSSGTTTVRVTAVAAPQLGSGAPAHLHPRAFITTPVGTAEAELDLVGDLWTGAATTPSDSVSTVDVYVPGIGAPGEPGLGGPEVRRQIRELATARLRRATAADDAVDAPLLAEIAAAASDSDF